MFQVNDYIVYKGEVCLLKEIKSKYRNDEDYYILEPVANKGIAMAVPVSDKYGFLRKIITKKAAKELIEKIPNIEAIDFDDDRMIENEYRTLMNSACQQEDLIRIIKTTYLRNDKRKKMGKKIKYMDNNFFQKAEHLLYNELAVALGMDYEAVKKYVLEQTKAIS